MSPHPADCERPEESLNRARQEPVAQMVEHLTFNQVVLGSSPSGLTNKINDLGLSFIIGLRPGSLMWEAAEPCAACVIFSPCAASHVAWNAAQASSRLSA